MVQAATADSRQLALDLHALLRDLDPARWRDDLVETARLRLQQLRQQLVALLERFDSDGPVAALQAALQEIVRLLEDFQPAEDLGLPDLRHEWDELRRRLMPVYEQLVGALKVEDIHVPSLRPTNYRRNVLHLSSGLVALAVVQVLDDTSWILLAASAFFLYAWSMEAGRRLWPGLNDRLMSFYGPVAHPPEWHRVNSATWYCTAMLGLAFTDSLAICSVAVVVLGFADPMAAIVGRRHGRVPLVNGRSLEGSATFLLVALTTGYATLAVFYPELARSHGFGLALGAASFATLAELFSRRIDDNLSVPLGSGAGMILAATCMGIAL